MSKLPSIRELDDAIKDLIGAAVYEAMRGQLGVGRPRMHEMACLAAFDARREDRHVEVLRTLREAVQARGYYPKECWTGEEDPRD